MTEIIIVAGTIVLLIRHRFFWRAKQREPVPKFMAHRGIKTNAPENSLAAYQDAISYGFEAIELDIVSNIDGQLLCSHNFDLERETSGDGWIHQKTQADLDSVRAGIYSHPNNPQPVPAFLDVVRNLPKQAYLNIEIKTKRLWDLSTAKILKRIIQKNQIKQPFMVSSFNPVVVAFFRVFVPGVTIGFILQDIRWLWVVHWIHPDFFHPRVDLVNHSLINLSNKHCLPLNVWTVNTLPGIRWCFTQPIQSIITDHPRPFNA